MEANSQICEGQLTRAKLHFRCADLYIAMNNLKLAVKEYTAALAIDPSLTIVRAERTRWYSLTLMKNEEFRFREWKQVVEESHPDSRLLGAAYAWMTIETLKNPHVGSYEDALKFKSKMESSYARHWQLYNRKADSAGDQTQLSTRVSDQFSILTPEDVQKRKYLDTVPKSQLVKVEEDPKSSKYACLNCKKPDRRDGIILSKCTGCMNAAYCSKECQLQDWKNHKKSCKMYRSINKKK
jgi:tetratricopeptide (TPR) repeat protein